MSRNVEKVTGAAQPAVSVCDLKAQVSVDDDYYNPMLESFGDAAQELVEAVTGRILGTTVYDLYLDAFPDCDFKFPHCPVTTLTSISYLVDGVYTEIDTGIYILGRGKEFFQGINLVYGQSWPSLVDLQKDCVKIRYSAGDSNVRANQIIKLLVEHWFKNRGATAQASTPEIPFGVQMLLRGLKSNV